MQTIIKKIADKHLYRVNSNLLEDYSTNPIPPNDTSYVGFFFEKDVTQFPPKLREKYEAMKAEIDLKEAEYREKYGDDWRNIAVFNAYRGIKEDTDSESEAIGKEYGNKRVAKAFGLSENHFSEKELTNMYSKFDKENNHDGLEAIEDYISAEADGNKAAAAKAAGKLKKLMKEDVSEAIKGWKNAHSDIAKARSEQGKNVVLHRLKNDGTESGMATARTSFSSEEEAIKQHENMVKLNPGKKIGHNLYVNGKLIKALGESVSDSTVKMSMPLFIRLMEWAFEECKDDVQIHKLAENLSEISSVADMEDYPKLVKEELDEALQGNWSVEKIQKLKPAQIKTLTANAKAANDKAVLDMIQVATAPKIKVQAPKDDPSKKVMPVDYYRVFDSLPDLDPADVIGMVSKKYSISDEDALKGLNRLAKQDKFKDYYAAVDSALKDYRKGLGEAYGDRKYGLKKTDADKAAKAAAIERAKDKLANLRKAHAEAEDAGDDAKADSLERQIKLAQADLGNIQAHG